MGAVLTKASVDAVGGNDADDAEDESGSDFQPICRKPLKGVQSALSTFSTLVESYFISPLIGVAAIFEDDDEVDFLLESSADEEESSS